MTDADERNPVDLIAEEFLRRRKRGEDPTVEEYAEAHPEIADDIREILPALLAMEGLKAKKEETQPAYTGFDPYRLERLGDYRIDRVIGRGGMGIVFDAEQESLGRHVAIKILPASSLLDRRRLERFQREAQTAARLIHPNIVPVFGVGEQDGLHYYVMQLIDGVGLDRVLAQYQGAELPTPATGDGPVYDATSAARSLRASTLATMREQSATGVVPTTTVTEDAPPVGAEALDDRYFRNVAQLGIQVSEALQYAHSKGTLHRDIKPANLLLDSRGNVWVTDFGIAKALEQDGITRSGDLVGTLQYMAPEQSQGRDDARSDVYSLGITLYEMVTLRRAWNDEIPARLIQRMQNEDPPAPRRVNPNVPRDLDTIIRKATSREPRHRYQDAAALGADLSAWLEGRPIQARPVMRIEQAWRWCKRNRLAASLAGTAALAVIVAVAALWMGYVDRGRSLDRERRQTEALSRANERAEAATRRARANLALALEAIDGVFDHLAGPDPVVALEDPTTDDESASEEMPVAEDEPAAVHQPLISKQGIVVLQDLLAFFGKFAAENAGNERLERETARATRRFGDIHRRLAQYDEASDAFDETLAILTKLPADDVDVVVEIGATLNDKVLLNLQQRRTTEARESLELARQILEPWRERTDARRCQLELVRTCKLEGWLLSTPTRRGRGPRGRPPWNVEWAAAAAAYEKALEICESLLQADPRQPKYLFAKASTCRELYRVLQFDRQSTAAAHRLADAVAILEDLVKRDRAPEYRYELARTYLSINTRNIQPDQRTEVELHLRQAASLLERLVAEYPSLPEYRATYGDVLSKLGRFLSRSEQDAEAEACYTKALEISTALVEDYPNLSTPRRQRHDHFRNLVVFLRTHGAAEKARTLITPELEAMEAKEPKTRRDRYHHGMLLWEMYHVQKALGETDEAEALRDRLRKMRRGGRGGRGGRRP